MPPKGKDKGANAKAGGAPKVNLQAMMDKKNKKGKPKKPPPPPKCFTEEELMTFKEIFKMYDEDEIEKIPLGKVPTMLRKLGFNPKGAEIKELYRTCLEDEFVDTIELYHWYWMVEKKVQWGDEFEHAVTEAMKFIIHDEGETGLGNIETLQTELQQWGEPLSDLEWNDFPKVALKEKALVFETGVLNYMRFIDRMYAKDQKFMPEPMNFWKLDQKTLAAMAKAKRDAETAEMEKKEAERLAREDYKRKKMIEAGLIQLD